MNTTFLLKKFSNIKLNKFKIFIEKFFFSEGCIKNIRLRLTNLVVKDVALLEALDITLPFIPFDVKKFSLNLACLKDIAPNINYMVFHIPIDFFNSLIENKEFFNIKELEEIRLNIKDSKIHVTGKVKKIVTIPFVIVLGFYIKSHGKKVKINIENIQLLNFLPLPFKTSILNFIHNYFIQKKYKFIENKHSSFIIDITKMIPYPIVLRFKAIELDDKNQLITIKA